MNVLCNGGIAFKLSLLYLLDIGSARELGLVLKGEPFLITTGQKVPRGTNGGVTPAGLFSSICGGLVIGFAYFLGVFLSAANADRDIAPNQLLVILVGGLGGLLGSLLDSLLGASLQFSGKDVKTGKIVEVVREGVVPISGKMFLDNNSVDLVSSI